MTESQISQRLAAVLSADAAGYSRLMERDEKATVATLDAHRLVFREHIDARDGRIVDTAGDSVLALFETATGAVRAAMDIQRELAERNAPISEARRMVFRIGINLGEIIEKPDGSIYGSGVNVAARLESLAVPGAVLISEAAHLQVEDRTEFGFADAGTHDVKNIAKPVRAFQVLDHGQAQMPGRARSLAIGQRPALRSTLIAGAIACAIAAGFAIWHSERAVDTEHASLPDMQGKPSIAVLPFKNLSTDPEQDYFAEGVAEDIITDLSKISGLFVISRNSSFSFASRLTDDGEGMRSMVNAAAAATDLNVRYVLHGSVRRSNDSVRINVQLLDGRSGEHLWAEKFDGTLADTFEVQDDITQKVVDELSIRVGDDERQLIHRSYTDNMQAYDLFLRGRKLQGGVNQETNDQARALMEQAIALDPTFSAAYSELSWIHSQAYFYQWTDNLDAAMTDAVATAEQAVALDDTLASARARLAWAYLTVHRFDEAVEEARTAIRLDPNYGDGYLILSEILIYAGLAREGIRMAQEGIPLDPYLTYHHLLHIANGHIVRGDYDRAIAAAKRSIDHNPDWPGAYIWLAALYGQLGPSDQAARMFAKVLEQTPDFSIEARRNMFAYRDGTITDWMIDGLHKARAAAES